MRARRSERGVALLAVLLGVGLLTVIVMDFATTAAMGHLTASNVANELRAYYLARSGLNVGIAVLAQDAQGDGIGGGAPVDALTDFWAAPFPPIEVDGGIAQIVIVDETRKLSVNRLINPSDGSLDMQYVQTMERLFGILGVPNEILASIIDWVDPNDSDLPGGAESGYYLRLTPPYAPRNGPMPTIGDLRMVRGVDEATFYRLRQYLTASPEMQVNVNTAPPEVLASLTPRLAQDRQLVQMILESRQLRPFLNVNEVAQMLGEEGGGNELSQLLTVRSDYFTISAMGSYAGARKVIYATFRREQSGGAMLSSWLEN